ncbi:MAG: hypothetical protein ATN34_02695 [Epulopiscium sp. Nele67-Bin002]|nr:MAG: hypothetical protein ATN34_02695 [Epulopiscium sp. Nele67-Bin002]
MKVLKGIFSVVAMFIVIILFILGVVIIQAGIMYPFGLKYSSLTVLIIFILLSNIVSKLFIASLKITMELWLRRSNFLCYGSKLVLISFGMLIIRGISMYAVDYYISEVWASAVAIWVLALLKTLFGVARVMGDDVERIKKE